MSHEPKILIVDDDPTLCKSLKVFLGDKLITAYAPTELEKETPPKGVYDSIMKPFDLEKLVGTVQTALNR
jgi:hypothetical protein